MPAIPLARVWRAAKPTTRPSTADDARMPVAISLTPGIAAAASPKPIRMISAKISRRTRRSRVTATGDSSLPLTVRASVRPRRSSIRSTTSAITKATRMVTPAWIQSPVSAAAV
jgi:hypothetical protein